MGENRSDSERLADHIEYLVDMVGPRHVGIGLDFAFPVDVAGIDDVISRNPDFWPRSEYSGEKHTYSAPSQLLELTGILLTRGYSERTVRDILGGNFMRLADEIWS